MTALEKIKYFLQDHPDVLIGYNELNFYTHAELDDAQIGYREGERRWNDAWLVIAVDRLVGDPIFVDTSSPHLRVATAAHGEGEWEPIIIADSLDSFTYIINDLKKLSINRESPVAMEKNPITSTERKQFLNRIRKYNPNSDIEYWEFFMEED